MSERYIGVGLAMVDEKIHQENLQVEGTLREFLDHQLDIKRAAGGVTPNILSTFARFDNDFNAELIARTGNDARGEFFRSQTSQLGEIQCDEEKPTGVVVSFIDQEGIVYHRDRDLGAAKHLEVGKTDVDSDVELFVSDLTTLRHPQVRERSNDALSRLKNGQFFLNLAGLNPAIAQRHEQLAVINDLSKSPDIVTGNEDEFAFLLGDDNFSIEQAFPDARLLILTLAEKGSIVRFEGEELYIPPAPVENVHDETGAGDTYAGLMLGALHTEPYTTWSKSHVINACTTAAYGASIVVASDRTRLSKREMDEVQDFHLRLVTQ